METRTTRALTRDVTDVNRGFSINPLPLDGCRAIVRGERDAMASNDRRRSLLSTSRITGFYYSPGQVSSQANTSSRALNIYTEIYVNGSRMRISSKSKLILLWSTDSTAIQVSPNRIRVSRARSLEADRLQRLNDLTIRGSCSKVVYTVTRCRLTTIVRRTDRDWQWSRAGGPLLRAIVGGGR